MQPLYVKLIHAYNRLINGRKKWNGLNQMTLKIKIPKEEIAAFCRHNRIRKLAFFGSVLRDDFSPQSDVDILVEFDRSVGMEFIHLCYELERLLNRKVDLVTRNGVKEKYYKEIESEMIYV